MQSILNNYKPFCGLHAAPFLQVHFCWHCKPKDFPLHGLSHCWPSQPAVQWHWPVSAEQVALFLPIEYNYLFIKKIYILVASQLNLQSHFWAHSSPNVPTGQFSPQSTPVKPGAQIHVPLNGEQWALFLQLQIPWQPLPYVRRGHKREQSLLFHPGLHSHSPVHGWHLILIGIN